MSKDTFGAIALVAFLVAAVWISNALGLQRATYADIQRMERAVEERCR